MDWSQPLPDRILTPETIRYELQRFGASVVFSDEVMRSIEVDYYRAEASRELVVKLVGIVATWRHQRLLKVPANWWEAFKLRFYPAWAVKRWPVLYECYDAAVVLPKVPVVNRDYHSVEFPVWQKVEP